MNLEKLNPENIPGKVVLEISPEDLREYSESLLKSALDAKEAEKPPEETYLTPDQFCEVLGITKVTLWNYDKKGITRPLRLGNLKRYRRSDLEKIMTEFRKEE